MRYATYDPAVSGSGPIETISPTMPKRQMLDKISEALDEQRFRTLQREPDGKWTLRWLDNTTGAIGEAEHTSPAFPDGPDRPYGLAYQAAVEWAVDHVDVDDWSQLTDGDPTVFVDSLHGLLADIAWRPRTGRGLVLRIEDDQHNPDLKLVTVRERWAATGRFSMPMATYELAMFPDVEHALDWASRRFGVDRGGWRAVAEGREYRHD